MHQRFMMKNFRGGENDLDLDIPNTFSSCRNLFISPEGILIIRNPLEKSDSFLNENQVLLSISENKVNYQHSFSKDEKYLFLVKERHILVVDFDHEEVHSVTYTDERPPIARSDELSLTYSSVVDGNSLILVGDSYTKPIRIFQNEYSEWKISGCGAPPFGDFHVSGGSDGDKSYIYGVCYVHTIIQNDQTIKEYGPISYRQIENISVIEDNNKIKLTGLKAYYPQISDKWDEEYISIEIYRTTADGSSLYYLDKVNSNEEYEDSTPDRTLGNRRLIYNQGQDDIKPMPRFKSICRSGSITYFANSSDELESARDRVYFSRPLMPWYIGHSSYFSVGENIKYIHSLSEQQIIAFTDRGIFSVQVINPITSNFNILKISSEVLASSRSVVDVSGVVFFCSNNGIYYTNGASCRRISDKIKKSYKKYSKSFEENKPTAIYNNDKNIICFVFKDSYGEVEKKILHLEHFASDTQGSFTTWSDSENTINDVFVDGRHLCQSERGLWYEYSDIDSYSDFIETDHQSDIECFLETVYSDLGYTGKKIIPNVNIEYQSVGSFKILVRSNNDGIVKESQDVTFEYKNKQIPIGQGWSESTPYFIKKIRFKSKSLRAHRKKVLFTSTQAQKFNIVSLEFNFTPIGNRIDTPNREGES